MSPDDPLLKYVSINRGRYRCEAHGSFCDSSDGYATTCPLCDRNSDAQYTWDENPIDRLLQIVRNLQERVRRNLSIILGLTGLLGAVSAINRLIGDSEALSTTKLQSGCFLTSFALLLLAIFFYLLSLRHVSPMEKGRMNRKSIDEWECMLVRELASIERWQWWGNLFFALSLLLIAFALVFEPALYEFLYWKDFY